MLDDIESKDINAEIKSNKNEYISPSKYYLQLSQYLEYYNFSGIKIVSSQDLRSNTERVVQEIYDFLDVNDSYSADIFNEIMYKTKDRKRRSGFDRFILDTLNGRAWLKPYIPSSFVESYQSYVKSETEEVAKAKNQELSTNMRSRLKKALIEDITEFRDVTGRKFSGWSL